MRIIKMGMIPEDRIFRCTCTNCSTEFEFAQKEGKLIIGGQRDGTYIEILCPTCEKKVTKSVF